jgi:phage tail-like protein
VTRGLIEGLQSPHPLGTHLPGLYLDDRPDVVSAFPLGTYSSEIEESNVAAAGADLAVAGERLLGFWVLHVAADSAAQGGRLNLALSREGKAAATGTLVCSGRTATFTTSECGTARGVYEWSFARDSLRLELVEDACASRKLVLGAHSWQRQSFVMRLMSAFDDVLAPVFSSLDNLDAYVDPRLAPRDFVDWLSAWVALAPNHAWPLGHRRHRIAGEVTLASSWGTADGIKEVVSIFAGVDRGDVEIVESGGVSASPTPGGEFPGTPTPQLTVRVAVPDPSGFDVGRLRRVVAAAKPAHLPHEVEVLGA